MGLHFLLELTMLTDKSYPTLNKNFKATALFAISANRRFFTFKYGLIINLVWALGMVCGMVQNFRTIPHTNPSYHTIFYSMPLFILAFVIVLVKLLTIGRFVLAI